MQPSAPPSATSVTVSRLELGHFRCHRRVRLDLGAQPVVLIGANGAGKTSILEALSLLAPGRGLRRAGLGDMVRSTPDDHAQGWSMRTRLRTAAGPTDVDVVYAPAGEPEMRERLRIAIDGSPLRGRSGLTDMLGVIWLTPEMDRLFTDPPGGRRRFLDRIVWGVDRGHAARVGAFERATRQRSVLLRSTASPDGGWLGALESTMAELGVAVAAARRAIAARLCEISRASGGPFPSTRIETRGTIETWLDEGPALDAEERMRAGLAGSRAHDVQAGGAALGPHRSEVVTIHGETGRPAHLCSTGEQKMLLISLVLCGARLRQQDRGAPPLLLLDEVIAHLDERHRGAVFEAVDDLGAQAWYAGTDRTPYRPLAGIAQFLRPDGDALDPPDERAQTSGTEDPR